MDHEREGRLSTADLAGAARTEARQDERDVERTGSSRAREDEDLRVSLQRYRSFFQRLLSV